MSFNGALILLTLVKSLVAVENISLEPMEVTLFQIWLLRKACA